MTVFGTSRTFLTVRQIDQLLAAVSGRYAARDRCLILLAFRHGLGVGEVCSIQVRDVEINHRRLRLRACVRPHRADRSHRLRDDEIRVLKLWLEQRNSMRPSTDDLFISANRRRLSRKTVWRWLRKYGDLAGLNVPVHPEILRESCRVFLLGLGTPVAEIERYLGRIDDMTEDDIEFG